MTQAIYISWKMWSISYQNTLKKLIILYKEEKSLDEKTKSLEKKDLQNIIIVLTLFTLFLFLFVLYCCIWLKTQDYAHSKLQAEVDRLDRQISVDLSQLRALKSDTLHMKSLLKDVSDNVMDQKANFKRNAILTFTSTIPFWGGIVGLCKHIFADIIKNFR